MKYLRACGFVLLLATIAGVGIKGIVAGTYKRTILQVPVGGFQGGGAITTDKGAHAAWKDEKCSPQASTANCKAVVNSIRSKEGFCTQTNPLGSKCTTIKGDGTCKVAICGGISRYVECQDLAEIAYSIVVDCDDNGTTGGEKTRNDEKLTVSVSKDDV